MGLGRANARMGGRRPSPKEEISLAECLQAKIRMGESTRLLFDCLCLACRLGTTRLSGESA